MENIIFLEFVRRGYSTYVGKFDDNEIDFVGEKNGDKVYVQVTYKIETEKTFEREVNTLLKINDNYHKYIVTLDDMIAGNVGGIEKMHIADFILKEVW